VDDDCQFLKKLIYLIPLSPSILSESDTEIAIQFPESCPWGMVVYDESGKHMRRANKHMQMFYFDTNPGAQSIEEQFHFRVEGGWSRVLESLLAGVSWTGRVVPLANQHGISSVEVMVYSDAEVPGRIWLYTLEHPSVNGQLRFSTRSEFKILQSLLDNTLEYVFLRDTDGRFIITNREFRKAAAVDVNSSLAGEFLSDHITEESTKWVAANDLDVIGKGLPSVNKVTHFSFKNGKTHWLQMTTVPVRSSDDVIIGSVSVARDISDLKRTESDLRFAIEEAKAASRAKGEFLAAMSHEIRTPINGIVGASELCQETNLDAEQRDYLDTVVQCSGTLMALINDVLDFSKIEAGQLNLEKLNFCPVTLLEDVAAEFSPVARKKGLELLVTYDDSMPRYVMGDPTRMKQVLYNLVSNAIKFTDTGEVTLRADTLELSELDARLRFSVIDTGIGIDASRCDAIFSSFTQADMSTTRKYGGTGLGLSISKELAELMGGQIDVESIEGKGAAFFVEIPFECTPSHGADPVPYNPELAGLHVLVVDDNQTNRDIYAQMCAGWGYRSGLAKDGPEALSMLEGALKDRDPYQLILLDHQMPGLSGLDLASVVRNRPELDDCRIILLSSSLNRQDAERATKFGVSRSLSKPVRRSTLLEVILETFEVSNKMASDGADVSSEYVAAEDAIKLSILLAEDNRVNQNIARRRLEKLGHSVMIAEDGVKVLELLAEHSFDCILMDIQIPTLDGYQTTRRIRTQEAQSGASPIFIIAMTAHVMKGDRERCLECGMNAYISKPFRVKEMKAVLEGVTVAQTISTSTKEVASPTNDKHVSFEERLLTLDPEDRQDVLSVAAIFAQTMPDEIKRLEMALKTRECQQVRFVAHSLKGGSSIFLCQPCVNLAQSIEDACRRNSIDEVDVYAAQLVSELHILAQEIEAVL